MYNPRVFDSDAYGVDTDLPLSVADWFNPSREDCLESQELYKSAMNEVLIELADFNGIDYNEYKEWDSDDWQQFLEVLGI